MEDCPPRSWLFCRLAYSIALPGVLDVIVGVVLKVLEGYTLVLEVVAIQASELIIGRVTEGDGGHTCSACGTSAMARQTSPGSHRSDPSAIAQA